MSGTRTAEQEWAALARRDTLEPYPLLEADELLSLPAPRWLVEGMIPEGLAALYGRPSTFKSFVALDLAMHVAAGLPWHGRPVLAGYVVYVAAEGAGGLSKRVQAWREANGWPDVERMQFLPRTVNLLDEGQVDRLHRTLDDLPEPAALVVIDTMARSMLGGDENHSRDVGQLVAVLDELEAGTRLVVHHTGKNGESERGSGALRGAADVMMRLDREDAAPTVQLVCDKAPKDAEEWPTVTLATEHVGESLVLRAVPLLDAAIRAEDERRARLLAFVAEHGPVSRNRIETGVMGKATLIRDTLDQLVAEGLLCASRGPRNALLISVPATLSPASGRPGTNTDEAPGATLVPDPPHHPRRGWGSEDEVAEPGVRPRPLGEGDQATPEQEALLERHTTTTDEEDR